MAASLHRQGVKQLRSFSIKNGRSPQTINRYNSNSHQQFRRLKIEKK